MIGIVVHSRSCRQTSMPSPSGSTRSMIAASGGRTAALSSASAAVAAGSTSKPASRRMTRSARRICGSSSQTSTRWRRAHAPDRPVASAHRLVAPQQLGRELDHEARPLARQRLDPDPAAVGLHEPAHDRQPEARAAMAGARGAGAVERLEHALALRGRDAGPAVDDADEQPPAGHARAHRDRVAARVARAVLEQVGERALELGGVGAHERQVAVERRARGARAGSRRSSTAASITSSIEHHSGRGSAAPPSSRERSSRLSIRRDRRVLSAVITAAELAPLLVASASATRSPRRRRRSRSAACAGRARPRAAARS